jgi:hypothetical protein
MSNILESMTDLLKNSLDGDPNMSRGDAIRNAYCYEWLTATLQK